MAYIDQDFRLWRGDYKRIIFTVRDIREVGAEDLEGANIRWVCTDRSGKEVVIEKESSDPAEIEIEGDKFIVKLFPEETKEIERSTLKHEARVSDLKGMSATVSTGSIDVKDAVTLM